MKLRIGLLILMTATPALGYAEDASWRATLEKQLPLLGHRNWIVVADSAYPWQTSPGIETIDTGADQLEVVKAVLGVLKKYRHVRPVLYTDAELPFVPENRAPGVTRHREKLGKILGAAAISLPHEEIIGRLDEAGKTFHVLLLKTTLALPYTSVFVQLDCGYWSAEAERALREAMKAAGRK